ncbi:damage-inducible protein DinB [Pseudomonas fluorescens]|uniref:Damage-inducible protein DinB n=1 Tax=Pseudomonas fluorescens TaxID=294 RepID=A0A327NBF0_PSEFL|nr:DinB family protein [Pseudomonas fluorescens]RAI72517.1 damage-inducible protein DinB [Pseudomonas fluorescens]
MTAADVFHSLFKYKAWSESELFKILTASPNSSTNSNMSDALWHLAHINIVDKLFIGRLQGESMPCNSTTTEEPQSIVNLSFEFTEANDWFVNYTKNLTETELDKRLNFVFADGKLGDMNRSQMLSHVLTHGLLHRGMVSGLLPFAAAEGWRDHFTTFLKAEQ